MRHLLRKRMLTDWHEHFFNFIICLYYILHFLNFPNFFHCFSTCFFFSYLNFTTISFFSTDFDFYDIFSLPIFSQFPSFRPTLFHFIRFSKNFFLVLYRFHLFSFLIFFPNFSTFCTIFLPTASVLFFPIFQNIFGLFQLFKCSKPCSKFFSGFNIFNF